MKIVFYLLFIVPLFFISCSEVDIVTIDDYVGNWSLDEIGTISLLQYGNVIATAPPLNGSNPSIKITKYGNCQLDIDGLKAIVQGSNITIDQVTNTSSNNGFILTVISNFTITSTKSLIYITVNYSGNWSEGNQTGGVGGSSVYTLKKLQ
jgi:hypothetical protein